MLNKIEEKYKNEISYTYNKVSRLGFSANCVIEKISDDIKIKNISCCNSHICVVSESGDVYTLGNGTFGKLGHGNNNNLNKFKKIKDIDKCKWSSCGYSFTTLVTENGSIYSFGCSEDGRLGFDSGNLNYVNKPIKLCIDWKAKKTFCGSTITIALSDENIIYSCGSKLYNGNYIESNEFKKIDRIKDILFRDCSIGPGGYHCLALSMSNSLYTWGHNRVKQLGYNDIKDSIFINDDDEIIPYPKLIIKNDVFKISTGWGHSAYLDYKDELFICGRNSEGQIPIDINSCLVNYCGQKYVESFINCNILQDLKIKDIYCGGEYSIIITKENMLYFCGENNNFTNKEIINPWKLVKIDNKIFSDKIKIIPGYSWFLILE